MSALQAVLSVIQAGAVIGAAVIGAWGLNTWRREMIGRKKADLAEQTLASFYEARDIIKAARFPGGFDHEGQTRPAIEVETESEAQYRRAAYVPAERLLKENEFLHGSKLLSIVSWHSSAPRRPSPSTQLRRSGTASSFRRAC